MTTKLVKIATRLNDEFANRLAIAVHKKYGIKIESHYSILAMALITTRSDDVDFTSEQFLFIAAFSDGYQEAMNILRDA